MGIIRVKKDKGFFAASNIPFNDKGLSWEARGIMGYLLSKPDEWQVRFYDLVKQGPAGEHKIRRILKELEELGYMDRQRIQNEDGKFDWISTIYETSTISRLPIYGVSTDGLPTGGSSTDGKPRDIVSTESESTDLKSTDLKNTDVLKVGGAGFYIFNLVGYDYKDADSGTRKAVDQLITNYSEYQICYMADDYVGRVPNVDLRALLSWIASNAKNYTMPEKVVEGEIGY